MAQMFLHKFGRIPDIDATDTNEDIWDGEGAYSWLTEVTALKAASESANDDDEGSGITTLNAYVLDANYHESMVTAELTGQTEVALGSGLRVYRAFIAPGTGTGDINAGNIWIGDGTFTAGVPANKRAGIMAGLGQTLMAIWTMPVKSVVNQVYSGGSIVSWYGTVGAAQSAYCQLALQTRDFGGAWRTRRVAHAGEGGGFFEVIGEGHSGISISPKTDIRVRALTCGVNNSSICAGFTACLDYSY